MRATLGHIASARNWPHGTHGDLYSIVAALGSGSRWPETLEEFDQALDNCSKEGRRLGSALGASTGLPDSINYGIYEDDPEAAEENGLSFAKTVIELATLLAEQVLGRALTATSIRTRPKSCSGGPTKRQRTAAMRGLPPNSCGETLPTVSSPSPRGTGCPTTATEHSRGPPGTWTPRKVATTGGPVSVQPRGCINHFYHGALPARELRTHRQLTREGI